MWRRLGLVEEARGTKPWSGNQGLAVLRSGTDSVCIWRYALSSFDVSVILKFI